MRLIKWIILVALIAGITGCSGITVSQDYDLQRDFSGLQAWAWRNESQPRTGDPRIDNPLLNQRIRQAVEHYMNQKGYPQAISGPPDFYVSYQYAITQKIKSDNFSTGIGIGGFSRGGWGGVGVDTGSSVRQYDEGYLYVDFTGLNDEDLIWRGIGSRVVFGHTDPVEETMAVNETIQLILNQYPPGQPQ
jgi:hypothetical protein